MPAKFRLIVFTTLLCFPYNICFSQQPKLMLPVGHTDRITDARFSPDGNKIYTVSIDNTLKIWESATGKLLVNKNLYVGQPMGEGFTTPVLFSPDGTKIATISFAKFEEEDDGGDIPFDDPSLYRKDTIKIWDALTGKLLYPPIPGKASCSFSADNKNIAVVYDPNIIKIFDLTSGKLLKTLTLKANDHTVRFNWNNSIVCFSPDGKKLITISEYSIIRLWDIASGSFKNLGHNYDISTNPMSAVFSPDSKKIALSTEYVNESDPYTINIMNAETGMSLKKIDVSLKDAEAPLFSPDSRLILVNRPRGSRQIMAADVYDATTGSRFFTINGKGHFFPDGSKIALVSDMGIVRIYDTRHAKELFSLKDSAQSIVVFSWDGKMIMTIGEDHIKKIWDATNGNLLEGTKGKINIGYNPRISPDGAMSISLSEEGKVQLWNTVTGKPASDLKGYTRAYRARYNEKGNEIILSLDKEKKAWDINSGILKDLPNDLITDTLQQDINWEDKRNFSPDGKRVLIFNYSFDMDDKPGSVYVCEYDPLKIDRTGESGYAYNNLKKLKVLNDHTDWVWSAHFSPDGKYLLTASRDNTIRIRDAITYELLFTFFVVNDHDFLVVDKDNHYDGTEAARKLLYFTCADEVISLDQLKDQLWVPDLASRLMKKERINAPKLSDLNICGLTPEVITMTDNDTNFRFKITARRGGLGETVLYINNIEAGRYPVNALEKKGDHYELAIQKNEFTGLLKSGEENNFILKAFTENNVVSSRGIILTNTASANSTLAPNLYAVMVGISDYKGDKMDLTYAAKDARDLSAAVAAASRKMLNADGKEHVFMYNVNTSTNRDVFPEKKSIKNIFDSIGRKANANDILLIFFAGHGVMQGEKKTFYFLTADASGFGDVAVTGISADELSEWIKPGNIKAQKRILIFDACNSGQAINDLVKIGGTGQGFVAARNDDKAEQVKAIDKLNEKSGLFILSASATGQSAYESGRYSQGILTYSLLKVIKDQPGILDNEKYLNVSRWFNAAEKMVDDLAKENNVPQNPQLVSTTNFNMGIIDDSVRRKIMLDDKTLLFTSCNFQNNDESIADDDLQLNKLINQELKDVANSAAHTINYVMGSTAADVYSLSGRYVVNRNELVLKINIKQGGIIKYHFDLAGKKDKLAELAKKAVVQVIEWMKK